MIRLDSTTRALQVVLAGAITTNQLVCTVSYIDKVALPIQPGWGRTQITLTNDITEVDICAAPLQNTIREIDSITIYNADTVSATVTVMIDDNATNRNLVRATLATLESLVYESGKVS